MAQQEIEKYYDRSGKPHTVKTEWNFGCYAIYVDGEFYTNVDDRLDRRETIDDLVKYKSWSETRPHKIKTPLVPASK